jgi:hypothetical protein
LEVSLVEFTGKKEAAVDAQFSLVLKHIFYLTGTFYEFVSKQEVI